jgi:hypothetical protein
LDAECFGHRSWTKITPTMTVRIVPPIATWNAHPVRREHLLNGQDARLLPGTDQGPAV